MCWPNDFRAKEHRESSQTKTKKYSQGPYALVVLLDLIQALQNILILTGILSSVNSSSPRQLGADTDY